jgi:hypothetical protein
VKIETLFAEIEITLMKIETLFGEIEIHTYVVGRENMRSLHSSSFYDPLPTRVDHTCMNGNEK